VTADGSSVTGPLVGLYEDWSVRLGPQRIKGCEVMTLRRAGLPLPPHPQDEQLVLANGDRLPLQTRAPLQLVAEALQCRPLEPLPPEQGLQLHLPLAAVAVLWLTAPDGAEQPEHLLRRLLAEKRSRDVVLLRNGDLVEGTVSFFDRTSVCKLDVGKKEVAVPFA